MLIFHKPESKNTGNIVNIPTFCNKVINDSVLIKVIHGVNEKFLR